MNLGTENEILEFKKSTSELKVSMDDICSMLNKHCKGSLYFGVKPNGDVVGQIVSASTLNDIATTIKEAIEPMIYPQIEEIHIDEKLSYIKVTFNGKERPYSSYGRYYKRVVNRAEEMTPSELRHMMFETDYTSMWENNLTKYTLDDIDDKTLKSFYDKSIACGRLESLDIYNKEELLRFLGLYENGHLTNAGYVLFSNKKPVVLKMVVYMSDERITFDDITRLEDNIYNLIDQGVSYINRHMNWKVELSNDGITRNEIPEVPVESIREILVNSFAHANYRGETEHEIDITPTQIEIYNPGSFPENFTPIDFIKRRINSIPRNKKILDILYKSKNVEIQGSGLRKVYKQCKERNIEIDYNFSQLGFSFIFKRTKPNDNMIKNDKNIDEKNDQNSITENVLNIIKNNPSVTRNTISIKINKSVRTVQRYLDKLRENNEIERIGSDKTGYWRIC